MWVVILLSVLFVSGLAGWFLPAVALIVFSAIGAVLATFGFVYAGKNDNGSGGIAYGWSFLTCAAIVISWAAFAVQHYVA